MLNKIFKRCALILGVFSIPFASTLAADVLSSTAKSKTEQNLSQINNTLSSLLAERLALGNEYAKTHWNQKVPIDNPELERAAIESLEASATQMGLDPIATGAFFQAQNEAFKMVLIENFDVWVNQDLHKHEMTQDQITLNQKLAAIDQLILNELKTNPNYMQNQKNDLKGEISKDLQKHGFSREVIDSSIHF